MSWCGKVFFAVAAVAAAVAAEEESPPAARRVVAEDADVSVWFERHGDEVWRPLAEQWDAVAEKMKAPVENLRLPLEFHDNGRIKTLLRAERAQIFVDGLIFALGVRVEMLTETGGPDGLLVAEGCLFDKNARHGYCRGRVSVEKDGDRLSGRDLYFSAAEQYIKILSECEIRTRRFAGRFDQL